MKLFEQPFDANQVKPNEAFEALPAGWYIARVVNSEPKPTKDNLSGYLELELEVIDGEHKGRKVFDRLNLWNNGANAEKTKEIAHRQLSAYCHATGVFLVQDSAQLHGIPVKIKLSVRTQEGYEPQNDVKAVRHVQDATPPAAAPASFTPANPQQACGTFSPMAPAPTPAPFGMNPSLPAQPAPAPAFTPPAQPAAPWGAAPVAPAPVAPAPAAQPWGAPAAPMQQPAPAAGPVPPWRK